MRCLYAVLSAKEPCLPDKNPFSDPFMPKCAVKVSGVGARARARAGGGGRPLGPAATLPGFAYGPGAVPGHFPPLLPYPLVVVSH